MRIKTLLCALIFTKTCLASDRPRSLKSSEEICQFYRGMAFADGSPVYRTEQAFLFDSSIDILSHVLFDMGKRDRLEMRHLWLLFRLDVERTVQGREPEIGRVEDEMMGAVSAAFCFEQSKHPLGHRAAMGMDEREVFGQAHRAAVRWGVPRSLLLDPPPSVISVRWRPDTENTEAWTTLAGEAWLRKNDPESARLKIDQRISWDYKIFCGKHVVCDKEQTVIAVNLIPPVDKK